MTKLECEDVNENLVRINSCRLKVVKRDVIEATVRYQFLQSFNNWNVITNYYIYIYMCMYIATQ